MKFADTTWWTALVLPADRRHLDALAMLDIVRTGEQVLTTNLVVGETWTLLRRRDSHRTAVGFIDRIDLLAKAGKLSVHSVTADEEDRAWRWLRHRAASRS